VLTVMSGVRQFLKSDAPLSDRIGTMIDEQLKRMDDLVGSIRRVGPEEATGGTASPRLADVVDAIEPVVRLAGKGRGVSVERGAIAAAAPANGEALVLAGLALLLPLLPPRGAGGSSRVAISATAADGKVSLLLRVAPARDALAAEDVGLVRDLLRASGGSLRFEPGAGGVDATLVVPAGRG
jgi:hypothetical protein